MRKFRTLAIAGAAAAALVLTSCSGPAATQSGGGDGGDGEPRTLKVQGIFSPGDTFADSTQAWGDYVEEATDGSLKMEYYWGNSIAPTNEVASAMKDGLIDVARQQPPSAPADFPVMNWLSEAASMNVAAMPAGLLQKVGAHMQFVMNSENGTPVLNDEMNNLGVQSLGAFAIVQQYDMLCRDKLETLDDFKGVKVRVAGQAWVEEAENLGMEPVTLLPEEIYEGYQRGIVDCVMTYPTHWIATGMWELGGEYVPVKLNGWNQDGITMSKAVYDSLSDDERQAAHEGTREWLKSYVLKQLDGYWQFVTEKDQHDIGTADVQDEVVASIDAHHEDVLAGLTDKAPEQVTDPQAFLDEYQEMSDEWKGKVADLGFDIDAAGAQGLIDGLEDPTTPPSEQIDLDPWLDEVMAASFPTDAE